MIRALCLHTWGFIRTHLGCQALEQRHGAFVANEFLHDGNTADLALEVGVLYPRFNRVERGSDCYRRDSTSNRRDEVLTPCRLRVVLDVEEIVLRHS